MPGRNEALPADRAYAQPPLLRTALLIVFLLLVSGAFLARHLTAATPVLHISSGNPGDAYFHVGAALQDVLENAFPGFPEGRDLDFVNLTSRGAAENVSRLLSGQAQLGLAEEGIQVQSHQGRGQGTDGHTTGGGSLAQRQIRSLVHLFNSPLNIVARRDLAEIQARARLESLGDLRALVNRRQAKRLPTLKLFIGSEGSGTEKVARVVLDQYGYSLRLPGDQNGEADLAVVGRDWTFADAARHLEKGEVDIAFFLTAVGATAVRDLAGKGQFTLLAVDRAQGIHRLHPYMDVVTIPASGYPAAIAFPDRDVQTIGLDEVLIASSSLSDKIAYRIAEALFAHSHELVSSLPFMTPLSKAGQLAQRFYYPPHPGAMAFYQGRPEPQGLVDFLQRYRDFLLALFSLGGTVWAAVHFLLARWRSQPLVRRLWSNPSKEQIYEVERQASHLFATGGINRETYESVKEYVRVRLNDVSRKT